MNTTNTGNFIQTLRKEQDLTQQALAARLHVSDKAVSRWETGKGYPDVNTLPVLADALGVSVAEILKGERYPQPVTPEAARDFNAEERAFLRRVPARARLGYLLLGFLIGVILLITAVVHIAAPIPLPAESIRLSTVDDTVVAMPDEDSAGCSVNFVQTEEGKEAFITCYDTLWRRWTGRSNTAIQRVCDESVARIYYYPGPNGDVLLRGEPVNGGVETLPRLVYDYWIILAAFAALVGVIVYLILRRRTWAHRILALALLPASLAVATAVCTVGQTVYYAPYYLSGILLLTLALYALALLILYWVRARRK